MTLEIVEELEEDAKTLVEAEIVLSLTLISFKSVRLFLDKV